MFWERALGAVIVRWIKWWKWLLEALKKAIELLFGRLPKALDDSVSAESGEDTIVQVLANDQGSNLIVTAVSDPPHGTAVLNPDGSITYRSDCGYRGSDSFTYTISDGTRQATAQVSVTVSAVWDLPYNGLMLGAACHDGEPGNKEIRNYSASVRHNALVMYLEHLDPIAAISTENRIDHFPLGATAGGYSDKTVVKVKATGTVRAAAQGDTLSTVDIVQEPQGGDIRWRLAKVASPEADTGTLAIGPIVGTTDRIVRVGQNSSWATEWASCGGTGPVPDSFRQYPTIWFRDVSGNPSPIDPCAQGWEIGDRIAFLVDNSAPDSSGSDLAPTLNPSSRGPSWDGSSRWSSVNMAFRRHRPDAIRSTYRHQRNVGLWWNSYAHETEYYPILLIGHQRPGGQMTVKGNAYGGYAGDGEVTFSSGTRLRQVIKIPSSPGWAGRTMKAVDVSLWRWNASATGSVSLVLRRAGSTPGGPNDDGTVLAQMSIAASSLYNADGNIKFGIPKTYEPHQTMDLVVPNLVAAPTVLAVQPGQAYYIELAPTSGSAVYVVGRVLNYLRGGLGLLKADHQDDTCRFQEKASSGNWTDINAHFNATNYLHLGVGLHFND